jgi:SAM-dependent methyltransferase
VADQQLYDRIGTGYSSRRRADPRWAQAIRAAIGHARNVLNVGAGTGSYEPPDLDVIALDPSTTMLAQRPHGAAPCVAAVAEAIPFRDKQFDVSTCLLTIHHWSDWRRGLAEVTRVTKHRIVIVTADIFNPDATFWPKDYFPEIAAWDREHMHKIDDILEELWPARVDVLPIPADFTDGCCGAFWQRPEAYLDPNVRTAISGFSLIPETAVARGLEELSNDLQSGTWNERYGWLLDRDQMDIGIRMIVAERP